MTQDPATTHAKRDTGPLAPIPPPVVVQYKRAWWVWAIGGVLVLLGIGLFLFFTRPGDPMKDRRPIEVVEGFVAAVEARDVTKMLSYVEPTIARREISPELRAYVAYIQEIRFQDPHYELLDSDGERAHVRLTATLHYQLEIEDGVSGDKPIDMTFELNKIEGTWYLHNVQLPDTTAAP